MIARSTVVLPQPVSPTSPKISPLSTANETSVAAAPEKRIETLRAQSHDRAPVPESRRRPSKKGQTTFEDY